MSTPHKCPVCEGKGLIDNTPPMSSGSIPPKPLTECRACDGKGIVWSPDGPSCPIPVMPEPYTTPYSPYGWPYAIPPGPWYYTPVLCRYPTERVNKCGI